MDMNTFSILVFHLIWIGGTMYYAYDVGKKQGRSEMVTDMLDRKLVTLSKLKKEYELL